MNSLIEDLIIEFKTLCPIRPYQVVLICYIPLRIGKARDGTPSRAKIKFEYSSYLEIINQMSKKNKLISTPKR